MRNPFRHRPIPERVPVAVEVVHRTETRIQLECGHWTYADGEFGLEQLHDRRYGCFECFFSARRAAPVPPPAPHPEEAP